MHSPVTRALALLAFFVPSLCPAQGHPEIVVGCDSKSNLVARFDASKPYPLIVSRFPGFTGYADAKPGFSSLFQVQPNATLFAPNPQSDIAFLLESADEGVTVWNDHGSAPMKPGELFKLGKPFFDSHPVWNIINGERGKTYTLRLRLRDLSDFAHDSEVFAPSFTPDDSAVMYSCPMGCQGGLVFKANGHCPKCGMRLKLLTSGNYRVKVTPQPDGPILPGHEAILKTELTAPNGGAVKDLEIVHEKPLHLLLVSDDLSWFAHEHPQLQSDNSFLLAQTFPHPGHFTLYHDFTTTRAGMQVVPIELAVSGEPPPPVPLTSNRERTQKVGAYDIELHAAPVLKSVQMQDLSFHLAENGKPVTDLEPYLGALGHLIIISSDRKHFVHSHPLPSRSQATTIAEKAAAGPDVVFNAQFPAPGLFKAWAQFQHRGRVLTAPFVLEVASPLAK